MTSTVAERFGAPMHDLNGLAHAHFVGEDAALEAALLLLAHPGT